MSAQVTAEIKGWCPSAHRPMLSGDGLLVRVHPPMARLTNVQALALCDLAETFGNGMIDVTSRANLQIRGAKEATFPALLGALIALELVDPDPVREARRAVTVTPFWQKGDLSARLDAALAQVDLPELPDKTGVVLDTGPARVLHNTSGDFRFEKSDTGALILRADGASNGREIAEAHAPHALAELAAWFVETGGAESKRMARHLRRVELPKVWRKVPPTQAADRPELGGAFGGRLFGVPFGQSSAVALRGLITKSTASHLRVTPWRMLFLEEAQDVDAPGFLSQADPLLDAAACPGAPACAQSSVTTRDLARRLAPLVRGTLHVSGCAKGCARRSPSDVTLVGRDGRFDLVHGGRPGDTPHQSGLSEADVVNKMAQINAL